MSRRGSNVNASSFDLSARMQLDFQGSGNSDFGHLNGSDQCLRHLLADIE